MYGRLKIIACFLVLAALVATGCSGGGTPPVYATVNGEPVSREEYQQYESYFRLLQPDLTLSHTEQKQILEDLVDLKIYIAEAERRGFVADAEAVAEEFAAYRAQLIGHQLFNGAVAIYYSRLLELGLSEEWIHGLLENYSAINAMVEAEKENVSDPTAEEVEEHYAKQKDSLYAHGEMRQVRHILVNKGNFPDDEPDVADKVKELATNLFDRLAAGADFAQLAAEYSQDGSADRGGDIGFIEKTDVVESFGDEAFALELGVVSQPVQSQYGWHILEVTAIRPAGHYELDEELKEKISAQLLAAKQQTAMENFLITLKTNAEIVYKFK